MKKLLCSLLIMASAVSFIGCGDSSKESDKSDTGNATASEESTDENDTEGTDSATGETTTDDANTDDTNLATNDNNTTTEDNTTTTENNTTSTTDNNASTTGSNESSEEVSDNIERTFKISTKDVVSVPEKIVYGEDIVTVGVGVADNIRLILEAISTDYFDGNIVELKTIDTVGDKKIAVINLTGDEAYWNNKFSGSAGGSATEYTLIENVLQKEYTGYWVDGVRFTLNDKDITDNGHTPGLTTTTYR